MAKKPDTNIQVVEVIDEKGRKTRPLKSAYTGTVAKGTQMDLTNEQVRMIGQIILEQIKAEIAEDTKKAGGFRAEGDPVPLPMTKKFADSFKFKISGRRTLEFTSDWPTARAHTIGRDPKIDLEDSNKGNSPEFPMHWLVSPQVPYARIVKSEGSVIVVSTPNPAEGDAMWVHPGFRRYSFLERGIRKGKEKAMELLITDILAKTISERGLFK